MNNHVTITDIRKAGHCVSGTRRWFEDHNMDFRAFIKEGLTVEAFLEQSSNDAHAVAVVSHMRREADRVEG